MDKLGHAMLCRLDATACSQTTHSEPFNAETTPNTTLPNMVTLPQDVS